MEPSQGVAKGGAGAGAARANQRTNMSGTLNRQGASNYGYLSNRMATATQQGIEQQQVEGLRTRAIEADKRKLARDKGDYKTSFRTSARESERKWLLENQALGSKNKYAKALVRQAQLGVKEKGTPSKHTNVNVNKGGTKDKTTVVNRYPDSKKKGSKKRRSSRKRRRLGRGDTR